MSKSQTARIFLKMLFCPCPLGCGRYLSSDSSSPLLSLVTSTSEISHQSVHTYTTYDNGVDRTGRQGMEEKYSITWGEGGEKKKLTPRLCSIWECVRTEKNTSAQKHIYHNHMTLQQGETYPALASSHPVGGGEWGRGVMSVIGEGARESPCSALPRVAYPAWPAGRLVRGSQKR